MWHLRVKDFPAVVTMDAHGASLHRRVEDESARRLSALARRTPAREPGSTAPAGV
jgi:fumarate hydratase class I